MTLHFWHQNTKQIIWSIIEIISFQIKFVYDIRWEWIMIQCLYLSSEEI